MSLLQSGSMKGPFPRRRFLKGLLGAVLGSGFLAVPPLVGLSRLYARARKKILRPDTPPESLINENPKDLDARHLSLTPLQDFGTMGLADHEVDPVGWSLEVTGRVREILRLSYVEVTALPFLERKVLMICPGFFVNQGLWKGISLKKLLQMAGAGGKVTHVTVKGPKGDYEKVERFPVQDILDDKIFLAYGVNGAALPRKHGFPLRLVAEDYYGSVWVKYVETVTFDLI
jgi:DMSO/TMAO reductase YedYZ molybdopterin-dependent catalytic subunit